MSWLRQAAFCASTRVCEMASRFVRYRPEDRSSGYSLPMTMKWSHICDTVIADIAGNARNGFAAERLHRTAQVPLALGTSVHRFRPARATRMWVCSRRLACEVINRSVRGFRTSPTSAALLLLRPTFPELRRTGRVDLFWVVSPGLRTWAILLGHFMAIVSV